ncbi:MAG: glycosyltransferase family 2 protein [Vulcanimicrobiota bacterium]
MDVSIVIPNFNDKDNLKVCLASIKKNLAEIGHEVIVIDNGSEDGSAEMVKTEFPWVVLIENEKNRYFATANNQGFEIARGEFIFILNSDTEVIGDIIQKMMEFMRKPENEKVAAVNCNVYFPGGKIQQTNFRFVNLKVFLIRFLILGKNFIKNRFSGFYEKCEEKVYIDPGLPQPTPVDWFLGAAVLARTSVIKELGGFDERYRLFFTDNELCYRMKQKGYELVSLPYDKIMHHHFTATLKVPKVNKILDEDTATYLKSVLGWPAFVIGYPLYLFERWVMRRYMLKKYHQLTR